jgi:hypothetical protein
MPTPSPQFRPGDRVRRIHSNHIMLAGGEYIVSHQPNNSDIFLEGFDRLFAAKHFIKVEPKKKTSGFKTFQNRINKP